LQNILEKLIILKRKNTTKPKAQHTIIILIKYLLLKLFMYKICNEFTKLLNIISINSNTKITNNLIFFISGTFSLKEKERNEYFPNHPGVGPYVDIGSLNSNTYYQWVPFYLFFLSITFYAPHFFWKIYESGKLKSVLCGFEYLPYSLTDLNINGIPTKNERQKLVNEIATYLYSSIKNKVNISWGVAIVVFEILTLLQLLFSYWLTNFFLGGDYTFIFIKSNRSFTDIFPTLTMCTFHTYGPTGNIQNHDAICLLALNNVNEKVFWILHYWFPLLLCITVIAIVWRLFTIILYRFLFFNRFIFKQATDQDRQTIINNINFTDWIFMCYISMNMDGFVFQQIYKELAQIITFNNNNVNSKTEKIAYSKL
jgi:hypothetical protein